MVLTFFHLVLKKYSKWFLKMCGNPVAKKNLPSHKTKNPSFKKLDKNVTYCIAITVEGFYGVVEKYEKNFGHIPVWKNNFLVC